MNREKIMSQFSDLASVAGALSGSAYFIIGQTGGRFYGNGAEKIQDYYDSAEIWKAISRTDGLVDIRETNPGRIYKTHVPSVQTGRLEFFSAFPIVDARGALSGIIGVFDTERIILGESQVEGITKICKHIGSLLDDEVECIELENFSELFELSEDLICICSIHGTLESVNPSFQRILGWLPVELIDKPLFDFVHKKDVRSTRKQLSRLLSDGSGISFTHRLLTTGGEYKTIEWVATVVPTTGKVSAIGRDITEELDKQHKLSLSEKKFKAFFENSQGLMCTHDLQGRFISVNESGARILGFTKGELDGYGLHDIVPKKRHAYLDEYLKAISSLGQVRGQMVTCAKDGSERIWMFSNVLQRDEDGEQYVIGNAVDITDQHALEINLRHTKEILEQTNKVARVGGWELDLLKNEIEWTPITKEIHGVQSDFVPRLSTALEFYKAGENRKKIEDALKGIMANGQPYDLELEIITAQGKEIWVRAIANAVFKEGICTRLFGTFQDIDASKKSEIALGKSKKLLDDVLNAASDLCIIATDVDGIITVFNKGAENLLGYSAEEMVGKKSPEILYNRTDPETFLPGRDGREEELRGFQYFSEVSKQRSLAKHQLRFVPKAGAELYVSLIVSDITDPEGNKLGYLGVATDITREREMEEALTTERARLLAFIEHTPAAVAMLDNDMRYLAVSRKWIEDYNFKNIDIMGTSHYDMFPNLDNERRARHQEILKGKIDRREEDVFIDSKTDERHFITLEMRPWYKSTSEIGGMMIFTQDISDMIAQREELRAARIHADEANLAKSEFLANMSHEIRTPLNGVIGFTDLVLKTNLDEAQQQYLKIVSQSAGALLNIINDILDFSKIEAGKFELDIEKCDLFEMTCQATDITTYQIQSKNLEMLLNLSPDLPRFVWTDDVRLKQVLINLLGNASKFTEQGEIELKVEVIEEKESRCLFRFSIRDTGIGIQEDKQEKIFGAFAQEDSSTTKKYGGTGLGLTISNKLLRMMGSRLELISKPGTGSTFYFDIFLDCEQGELIEWGELESVKKVLIVDDNDNNRNFLSEMLRLKGIEADAAKSGFEALQYLAEKRLYDVVLMDYHMPFMDGLETTEKIRKSFFATHEQLPILLLHSSADDSTLISSCRELQVRHRMAKPIKMPELYNALSRLHAVEEGRKQISGRGEDRSMLRTVQTGRYTVMIVEDNEVNRFLTRSLINNMYPDIQILEAKNGQEGLDCYLKNSPDLILMDVQMPVMNGYQASRAIRSTEKHGHVPIVAVTAGNVSGEREKCFDAGMDDFITKPILEGTLEMVLGRWISEVSQAQNIGSDYNEQSHDHFDPGRLKIYYGENREKLQRIVALTIEQLDRSSKDFAEYIAGHETDNIRLLGHKVYGTSVSAGLVQLARISLELETLVSTDRAFLSELYDAFSGEITILKGILTATYLDQVT